MCSEKDLARQVSCPHLQCNHNDAMCSVAKEPIEDIADADIRFCIGRHYEACHLYYKSIQETAYTSAAVNMWICNRIVTEP